MAENDEKVSTLQGCTGCLVVTLLVIGGIGWYGWTQYQQLISVFDFAEGKIDVPWEVTAIVYFGPDGDPGHATDTVMDRLETLAGATGGTAESAFQCAFDVCSFLTIAGVRFEPGVVLGEMASFSSSLPYTVNNEQFMRAFIQRCYPEAERRIVDNVMGN